MIKGIGVDILELSRVKEILDRQPKFIDRILTAKEKEIFSTLQTRRRIEYAAGRFAAKEALSKARGTGIGKELSFLDIEILPDEHGKPTINAKGNEMVHLSISHSMDYVVAQVIIEEA